MIYCVVPEAMGEELFDRMVEYYAADPNVTVIKDRRTEGERRRGSAPPEKEGQRVLRDRRRRRPGDFPPLKLGS